MSILYIGIQEHPVCVKHLQTALNRKNEAGLKVDGVFGLSTLRAVLAFQEKHGLTENGVVDSRVWKILVG